MIGGVAVARATVKARPDLSDDILIAVRKMLAEVGAKPQAGAAQQPAPARAPARPRAVPSPAPARRSKRRR